MKLIIDIPDETYTDIKDIIDNRGSCEVFDEIEWAIADGIPLEDIEKRTNRFLGYVMAVIELEKIAGDE